MNKEILILSSEKHPFHELLKKGPFLFKNFSNEKVKNLSEEVFSDKIVFDFTLPPNEEKTALLDFLNALKLRGLFSETSLYWSELFLQKYDNLSGVFGCSFYSPNNKAEYCLKLRNQSDSAFKCLQEVFSYLNLKGIEIKKPGIGFHYPRIISMIINEAFFALDENLANREAIDTAMKYGVNYPLGPLEWAEKIGTWQIAFLLQTLKNITGLPRYNPSPKLLLSSKVP